ncbi:MAG TPA: ATP-binding protein, partial [Thermodesulfobacteriota bacterium]|nr:ATP-binding protein [Thermodesulfobacteriota bacterium]
RKVVTLNRRAAEILGAGEKDFKGKPISDILGREVDGDLGNGKTGATLRNRETEANVSGKRIPLSLSSAPLRDDTGKEMGSVLLIRDLREIRDLQEKVRRSERLASLGRLAAGVAHEIRNPLSSIRGFTQFFQHRLKGQEKEQEYAALMIKEVDRLNRVITDLLDFARPKEPHREPLSIPGVLDGAFMVLEPELAKKNAEVEKAYHPGLPPAEADRDQLYQAFINVLLNAIESISPGGKIRASVQGRNENGRETLQISISDNGNGISPEDRARIFEPFFSTKRKGTGLGLSIVHQIVEQHGGDISVESREGEGTTFRISLPVFTAERRAENAEKSNSTERLSASGKR